MIKVMIHVDENDKVVAVNSSEDIQYVIVKECKRYGTNIDEIEGPFENDWTITEAGFEDLFGYESDKEVIKNIKWFQQKENYE